MGEAGEKSLCNIKMIPYVYVFPFVAVTEIANLEDIHLSLRLDCNVIPFWQLVVGSVSTTMFCINSAINFFLYPAISKDFRAAFKEFFISKFKWIKHSCGVLWAHAVDDPMADDVEEQNPTDRGSSPEVVCQPEHNDMDENQVMLQEDQQNHNNASSLNQQPTGKDDVAMRGPSADVHTSPTKFSTMLQRFYKCGSSRSHQMDDMAEFYSLHEERAAPSPVDDRLSNVSIEHNKIELSPYFI